MKYFNDLRLRCFIFHLITGSLTLLVGISILLAVLSEMINEYDTGSRNAYVIGIICSILIILFGLYVIRKGNKAHIRALKELSDLDIERLQQQLGNVTTKYFEKIMIVTDDFIIVYVRKLDSYIKVFKIDSLTACFGRTVSVKNDTIGQYEMTIADKHFNAVTISVKGAAAIGMSRTRDAIMARMPYILNEQIDDRMDFLANCRKLSKRKVYRKMIERRRGLIFKAQAQGVQASMKELLAMERIEKKQKAAEEKAAKQIADNEKANKFLNETFSQPEDDPADEKAAKDNAAQDNTAEDKEIEKAVFEDTYDDVEDFDSEEK